MTFLVNEAFPVHPQDLKNRMSILLVILLGSCIEYSVQNDERNLSRFLISETDSAMMARPIFNQSKPIRINFGFELIHLLAIVEHDQTIITKVWMRMSWTNEFLKWNPLHYGNVTQTKLSQDQVWSPDIFQMEDVSDSISGGPDEYKTPIVLKADGTHSWLVPAKLTSSCEIDVTDFPFDHQKCTLTFGSWTSDRTQVDIEFDGKPLITDNYINSSAWTVKGIVPEVAQRRDVCCTEPFTEIRFDLLLNRKPLYYISNVIVPCIIQMLVILFTFFLPPDSGERVGVVITVLLVFAVYLEVISSALPTTSTTSPMLGRFYSVSMAESAASLIATCFVLAIHFKGAEKGVPPMPDWVRRYFLDMMAPYLFVRINIREYANSDLLALKKDSSGQGPFTSNGSVENKVGFPMKERLESETTDSKQSCSMKTLITEVKVITGLIEDLNRQEEIEEEWQILGKVLDRLFFFFFLIIFLVSSCVVLLPVYLKNEVL